MSYFTGIFDRKPTKTYNVFMMGNTAVQAPVDWKTRSPQEIRDLYTTLADIFILENYISEQVSKIPVAVVNRRGTQKKGTTPLGQLIEQPNATQTWQELVKEAITWYGISGNLLLHGLTSDGLGSGYYSELFVLDSSTVEVILQLERTLPEFKNWIAGYTTKVGGIDYPLEVEDILHMKTVSLWSENGLWAFGASPYLAGNPNVETLEANYSSRLSTIRDRGALGFISNKSLIPDPEESARVKQDLKDKLGLREDQDKFIVSSQDLVWNQMSLPIMELELIQNLATDFSTLAKIRSLDPNIFSAGSTTYDNQRQIKRDSVKDVIKPLADKFYGKLNKWLYPRYGEKIEPQYSEVPELEDLKIEQSKKIREEIGKGILTPEQGFDLLYGETDLTYIKPEPIVVKPTENPDETDEEKIKREEAERKQTK